MRKILKIGAGVLVSLVVLGSIGLNLVIGARRWLDGIRRAAINEGVQLAVMEVIRQAKTPTGAVINVDKEEVTLIVKQSASVSSTPPSDSNE